MKPKATEPKPKASATPAETTAANLAEALAPTNGATAAPNPAAEWLDTVREDAIVVEGARVHNLKNINVTLPREQLVVITGVSGSGKSSLAFDTLYAEGQRRYLETYGSYVRQFIGGMERPDVDKVTGLSPVIAIDQKTTARNPRSTVGTVTEIYDFLRLLFARASIAYSYVTGQAMEQLSDDEIVQRILRRYDGRQVMLLAPVIKGRKGHYREELEKIRKAGYSKARIDGVVLELAPKMSLDRFKTHDIEAVVDRLTVNEKGLARLSGSVKTALNYGKRTMLLLDTESQETQWYCRDLMDPESGISYDVPAPNSFSFNSPYGACPTCDGLGEILVANEGAIVRHPENSIVRGALAPLDDHPEGNKLMLKNLRMFLEGKQASIDTPWEQIAAPLRQQILYGEVDEFDANRVKEQEADSLYYLGQFIGLTNYLILRYRFATAGQVRHWAEGYLEQVTCPSCGGARLKKESLHFKIDERNIHDLSRMNLADLRLWLDGVEARLSDRQRSIAHEVLKEIRARVQFLLDVGLDYLSLERPARTLSGGEAQRIRLATQIGSQLTGVLYILDEPSIGLHQRDNQRLIDSLLQLRDLGNSVLVVEHDKDMMLAADHILDIGPRAGVHGGRVVAQGSPAEFLRQPSATAEYLSGQRQIALPAQRRIPTQDRWLRLVGCQGHNLQDVTLSIPLGTFTCISGVSGSGKSSLVNHTLYPILHQHAFGFAKRTLPHERVEGLLQIDKVIEIDQKPIGRTPRSNPATYTGLFTHIRELMTQLPESQIRGYKPGRFSFNVKGGRCETCGGAGLQVIEMNFLPDVHVQCPDCRGRRYNRETLEIRYKGKSIADVLDLTVDDALTFFQAVPQIRPKLEALQDVGLGYIRLGQAATTLSGGEAQRMKIATELAKRSTGQTFYILDEPTTGLHFQDIEKLLEVLQRLVDKGNTVLVIEHNLDVIKVADWVIDIGPEGGHRGGTIVAEGPPEAIAATPHSHTGRFLKGELG